MNNTVISATETLNERFQGRSWTQNIVEFK